MTWTAPPGMDVTLISNELREKCPKCGRDEWDGPKWKVGPCFGDEWLAYKCAQCTFERLERPLDWVEPSASAPPPPPPAPPGWSDPNTEIVEGPGWLKRFADWFFCRHTDVGDWRTPR